MNARRTTTILTALAVTMLSLSSPATAGDPLEKLLGKVGKYVEITYPAPRPTPLPYPLPYPRPVPTPCPQPVPAPWEPAPIPLPGPVPSPQPAPSAYFLGVYTSTVAISLPGAGPVDGGPQAYVVPGYGEQVYGQRVNQIVPNSPAFHAGLEPGDILVNANGTAMESEDILRAAIAQSEGYMELQVLDSRSGQLVWVVAETDAQNSVPMVASSGNLNAARKAFKSKSNERPVSAKTGARVRSLPGSTASQPRQVPQTTNSDRRPPVRRR
jgi:membrane-associated protease RseP (regulator of RpoE activity)